MGIDTADVFWACHAKWFSFGAILFFIFFVFPTIEPLKQRKDYELVFHMNFAVTVQGIRL